MTSKLKCPFCQTELDYDGYGWDYSCPNHKCRATKGVLCGTKSLWQALIQSQQDLEESQQATLENAQTILEIHKDLEIARKALEEIKKVCDGCRWCGLNLYDPTAYDGRRIAETAYKALEQIGHKE